MDNKLLESIGALCLAIGLICIVGLFSGTILWLVYDHIHALFPTAAEKGIIADSLSWWDSVCISWIACCLTKASTIKIQN
jgi:hypothetical protein